MVFSRETKDFLPPTPRNTRRGNDDFCRLPTDTAATARLPGFPGAGFSDLFFGQTLPKRDFPVSEKRSHAPRGGFPARRCSSTVLFQALRCSNVVFFKHCVVQVLRCSSATLFKRCVCSALRPSSTMLFKYCSVQALRYSNTALFKHCTVQAFAILAQHRLSMAPFMRCASSTFAAAVQPLNFSALSESSSSGVSRPNIETRTLIFFLSSEIS